MMKKTFFSFILCVLSSQVTLADLIYRGDGQTQITLSEALRDIQHGDVLVLGEIHGQEKIAAMQMQVIETLKKNGISVSIGMEFLEYPDQYFVDQYRAGKLSEADFLKKVRWGNFPFSAYREQILFPQACGLSTLALNAPRELTSKIAKSGLDSLTEMEKDMLPSDFTLGNAGYFERFKEVMGGHVPESKLKDYFAAQSAWDETMAWKANQHLSVHPDQVLVIIVGEFHVRYGGGLPDRLRARGAQAVHTMTFVNTDGLTPEERSFELLPSSSYGQRSDFIWEVQIQDSRPMLFRF